jgi:hypothetical protein
VQYEDKLPFDKESIFTIDSETSFNEIALLTFQFQRANNRIYKRYCELLNITDALVSHYSKIPFLPIEFFKNHAVVSFEGDPSIIFSSSGTTGSIPSLHRVKDLELYQASFTKGFEFRYGPIEDYVVFGLLPSYLERGGSSLVYMVDHFIQKSNHPESGFFMSNFDELNERIKACKGKNILLIGVAYALLDFGELYRPDLSGCIVMETGGMKGRRKEMIKSELHLTLKEFYNTTEIHSEYGMTELLSQAYSVGLEFITPPWMKILTRSYTDPFELIAGKTGGINVIDLANVYSCSFIATQDLGRVNGEVFEIAGRYDLTDIRGCNLLVQ